MSVTLNIYQCNFANFCLGNEEEDINSSPNGSRYKRQTERQTNERFRAAGPRRCRVLRRTNCQTGGQIRRSDIEYTPYSLQPKSVFKRIALSVAKGASIVLGRNRAKMLAIWIKNKLIFFTSPAWFALVSAIGALIVALMGTYFLPFLP